MATLAEGGRISVNDVERELQRLQQHWPTTAETDDGLQRYLTEQQLAELDLFDRVQLATVVRVCRQASSLSEAGRQLFAASRQHKRQPNDADRLRKYLARFELEWSDFHPDSNL